MTRIWELNTSFETYMSLSDPNGHRDVNLSISTGVDKLNKMANYGRVFRRWSRDIDQKTYELEIPFEDFGADYFSWGGVLFVSERMRQAMALPASEVRFFDVDTSLSAPLPRSMNYQIMQPTMAQDVVDRKKSKYKLAPGIWNRRPNPDLIFRIAIQSDAKPACDLFHDRFFSTVLLCTDAFAARVLKAGCSGMEFANNGEFDTAYCKLVRTLRGVEKVTFSDGENTGDGVELIEPMD